MNNCYAMIAIVLVAMTILIILYRKMKDGFGPFNLKAVGITLIATFVSILSLSNIESDKLLGAYGILGGIAGYLFGVKDNKDKINNQQK